MEILQNTMYFSQSILNTCGDCEEVQQRHPVDRTGTAPHLYHTDKLHLQTINTDKVEQLCASLLL